MAMTIEAIRDALAAMGIPALGPGAIDDNGCERYKPSKARLAELQYVPNNLVTRLQETLNVDADGSYGRATVDALQATIGRGSLMATYTPQAGAALVPDVPHISQGDPRIEAIEIVPGKPVRQIGCLTVCCEAVRASTRGSLMDVGEFVRRMKEFDGYDGAGNLKWDIAAMICGFDNYERDVTLDTAKARIDNNFPVFLRVIGKSGHEHFVLGIGYDATGWRVHDVGTRFGSGYTDPARNTFPYDKVTRIDLFA